MSKRNIIGCIITTLKRGVCVDISKAREIEMVVFLIKVSELFGSRVSVGIKLVNQVAIESKSSDSVLDG